MLDRLLLETDHLRKAHSRQELYVEDLLDRGLELQQSDDLTVAPVHHSHATCQLLSAVGQWDAVHRGRWSDLRQPDEGIGSAQNQTAGEAGQLGYLLATAAGGIDEQSPGPGLQEPQPAVVPARRTCCGCFTGTIGT